MFSKIMFTKEVNLTMSCSYAKVNLNYDHRVFGDTWNVSGNCNYMQVIQLRIWQHYYTATNSKGDCHKSSATHTMARFPAEISAGMGLIDSYEFL